MAANPLLIVLSTFWSVEFSSVGYHAQRWWNYVFFCLWFIWFVYVMVSCLFMKSFHHRILCCYCV